jgi:ADP-heptose:LPS heptosyltransferase
VDTVRPPIDIADTAKILSQAEFYLGGDTGLMHLSESVGTPVLSLWGPTKSDMGFGPWHPKSIIFESNLWCRPCGKDGRFCFRLGKTRHLCQKLLLPEKISQAIKNLDISRDSPL